MTMAVHNELEEYYKYFYAKFKYYDILAFFSDILPFLING